MKKIFVPFASTLLALLSASSYATDNQGFVAEDVKGSITVYTHRTDFVESGVFKRYEKEFQKLYPAVTEVKVIAFADYQGGLRTRMNTEDYGDIVFILPSVPTQQYSNFYLPLNDLFNSDDIYFHDSWEDKGLNFAVSAGGIAEGLVYNKTVFEQAGIDVPLHTLSEFYAAAEKIKSNDKVPVYINFGAQWPLQQWDKYPVVLEGNNIVYEKMLTQEKPFSDPDSAYNKSLRILKTLIDNGYTEKDLMTNSWEDSKNSMANGDVGMFYFGNWVIPQILERGANSEDIGFMPIPSGETGPLKSHLNHDWGYAVSKFSKNPETAKAFVKYIIEESDYATISGLIPTLKSRKSDLPQLAEYMSYEPLVIQNPTNTSTFIEVANRSKLDFYAGGYIQDIMTSKDFNEATEKLDARWNRAKKRVMK